MACPAHEALEEKLVRQCFHWRVRESRNQPIRALCATFAVLNDSKGSIAQAVIQCRPD